MNKAYARINWENYPSDSTPLNERNLNKIDAAVDEIDDRVITHEATKLDKTTAMTMVKDVTFDETTGIFTVAYLNGATIILDTKLEKLAVNFDYDKENQQLIIILDDGTRQYVDLSSLITEYEFSGTDTVTFDVDSAGKVSASVKDGSITENKLQPNFLADVKVEVVKAQASATAAATSEINAKTSETNAKTSETNAKTSETNAKASETNAASSAGTATSKATAAATSATNAATSENNAATSAASASASATNAADSATSAANSANTATAKAAAADNSASSAATSATNASDYAIGSTNSAKYYYEQAKSISESLTGALRPMGTVTFTNLPAISSAVDGDMYNISNEFTTTSDFKEGAGNVVPAGTNVYKTADGKWDILAGTPVTGVKGNAESSYRRGNVNITPENIGALPEGGNAVSATKATQDENGNNIVATYQTKTGNTNNNSVTFTTEDSTSPTAWTDVELIKSGEKHSSLFNKISTMFKNARYLYKILGNTDISSIGDGTCTGAIVAQNETLTQLNTNLNEYTLSAITIDNLASATSGINIAYSDCLTNFNFVSCSLKEAVSAKTATRIISSFDAYIAALNYTTIPLIVLNPNNVVMGCGTALVLDGAVYVWADIDINTSYKLMGCCTRWISRT